jgi:hypothetical protein
MEFPTPMPTSERLPARAQHGFAPFSSDVLAFDPKGGWQLGSYRYANETGNDGSWEINGEVVDALT